MRVGLFDHFGYAVAVTVTDDHEVVDRRRIALVADDVTDAPVHYDIRNLDDDDAVALLERWRTSVREVVRAELEGLPAGIVEMCLRDFPDEYPNDPSTLRNDPYNGRADAIFYRQLLANEPVATHPLVRIHPVTGRPAVFLGGAFMRGIAGMHVEESDALLGFLQSRLHDPNLQVRWRWRQHDVAMWDERCTNHRGLSDHFPQHRLVRRVVVGEGVPVGPRA